MEEQAESHSIVTGERYNLPMIWPMPAKANDRLLRNVSAVTKPNSAADTANCQAITNLSQSKSMPELRNEIETDKDEST
jgi:predicted membrane-bound mannosyltransferase